MTHASYRKNATFALIAGLALFGAVDSAAAIPLDKETCAQLGQEKQGLETMKVRDLMVKGPEWASANLSLGDLNLIRRYIEVDEQIKFRCTPAKFLVKLRGLEEDGEEETGSGDSADAGDGDAVQAVSAPPLPDRK